MKIDFFFFLLKIVLQNGLFHLCILECGGNCSCTHISIFISFISIRIPDLQLGMEPLGRLGAGSGGKLPVYFAADCGHVINIWLLGWEQKCNA